MEDISVENNTINKNKKRPKRRNKNSRFLSNAKGFAKKGIFGRGTHIADDQYSYFINILDALKVETNDVEERVNMANNVFEQTIDQEEHLASNQIVSKALEALVGFIEGDQLERLMNAFSKNLRPICSDRFASHVLQKLVEIAFLRAVGANQVKSEDLLENDTDEEKTEGDGVPSKRAKLEPKYIKNNNNNTQQKQLMEINYNLNTEFSVAHRSQCSEFVLRISKFMLNNLEDFVWDRCANPITRTVILCLVGVHIPKVAFEKATGVEIAARAKTPGYKVPAEWLTTMKEFAQRLEMWPQFVEFPYDELTSALTSIICIGLRVVDKSLLKHFGRRILMEAFLKAPSVKTEDVDDKEEKFDAQKDNPENGKDEISEEFAKLPQVFQYHSAVMLLETLLCVAGRKLFTQLYGMLFTTRCGYLSELPLTNYAVQRLLQNISEREDFDRLFDELQPHLENLLKIGHTAVVSSLGEACLRLGAKQAPLLLALQQVLHTTSKKGEGEDKTLYFFQCLVKLKPYEIVLNDVKTANSGATSYVHLHGSLLVQYALEFNKPIFLVNSILSTPAAQLTAVLNTPNGSHIADAFMRSKFVGEKSRERFIRQLDGFYVDLAVTKFGSRVVEACYGAAQDAQKAYLVKQLSEKHNMLCGSPFGRLLYSKFRIETYRLSAAQWRESLKSQKATTTKTNKAEELFKDIIE